MFYSIGNCCVEWWDIIISRKITSPMNTLSIRPIIAIYIMEIYRRIEELLEVEISKNWHVWWGEICESKISEIIHRGNMNLKWNTLTTKFVMRSGLHWSKDIIYIVVMFRLKVTTAEILSQIVQFRQQHESCSIYVASSYKTLQNIDSDQTHEYSPIWKYSLVYLSVCHIYGIVLSYLLEWWNLSHFGLWLKDRVSQCCSL